jgi:predicted RNase H-like HicB family nuclease
MDQPVVSLTAVFLKGKHGYTAFVEELPGVNSQGQTLQEARANLQRLAAVVFDEERQQSAELLEGQDVVREQFRVAVPRA